MTRVLNRMGARELKIEELDQIHGATGTGCHYLFCHLPDGTGVIDNMFCDPS